ncbi:MAG TPA: anti-phage ZorAB system protein ZorA [Candidatus Krumholzibacteria bacterium]|nr:anti-phage ZorAB system protein ZorA [Candidatus Krumholzibacteria bacterium]
MQIDFTPVLKLLVSTNFLVGYCGFIAIIFSFFLARMVWKTRRIRRDLKSATAVVNGLSEESFFTRFEKVDKAIGTNATLGHLWSEFKESLIFPAVDGPSRIQNGKEPADHFHLGSIVDPVLSMRGYGTVPNYLTGLGILGTFLGLAAGIYLAQPSLASAGAQNAGNMAQGLEFLLHGASLAFGTSIAGLFCSLVFLLTERGLMARVGARVAQWNEALDRCLTLATPAQLASQQLKQLEIQTHELQTFNTDLAVSIASALDEKMAARLTPALRDVVEAVDKLREDQAVADEKVLEKLLDRFHQTVTGAAGDEISTLGSTLEEVNASLRSTIGALQERDEQVSRSIHELSVEVDRTMREGSRSMRDDLTETLRGLRDESARALDEMLERLKTVNVKAAQDIEEAHTKTAAVIDRSKNSLEAQLTSSEQTLAALNEAASHLQHLSDSMRGSLQGLLPGLKDSSEAFGEAGRSTREVVQRLGELGRSMQSSAETAREAQDKLTASWSDYQERFAGTDSSLRRVFDEIDSGVERFTTRIAQFNQQFDKDLSEAVRTLSGVVQELEEMLDGLIASRQRA